MTSNVHIEHAARLNERITRHNHIHRDASLAYGDIIHCGTHAWTQGVLELAARLTEPEPLIDEAKALWADLSEEQKKMVEVVEHSRTAFGKHTGQCHDDLLPTAARIHDKILRAIAINDELAAKYPDLVQGSINENFTKAKRVSENFVRLVRACHTH